MVPVHLLPQPLAKPDIDAATADGRHPTLILAGVDIPVLALRFAPNEEIFGEQESAAFVYKVISGAVRSFRTLDDGHRQIGNFYLAGEMFGVEAGEAHRLSAEAIGACDIVLARRSAIEHAANRNPLVRHALRQLTFRDLQRAEDHLMLLGRKSATERVVSFLRDIIDRGGAASPTHLPISRTDIADYLGLTIGTLSRILTQLERSHAISMISTRQITFHGHVLPA